MGFASMLEDIHDRWTVDHHSYNRWQNYTAYSQRQGSRASRRSDRPDLFETIELHGDPFEWPRRLIADFQHFFEGTGLTLLGRGRWEEHIRATRAIHEILTAMRAGLAKGGLTTEIAVRTEEKLRIFFASFPQYGQIAPTADRHILGMVDLVVARAKEIQRHLEEFRLEAARLAPDKRELASIGAAIKDLKKIEKNLQDGFVEVTAIESIVGEVRELWAEFLRLHVLSRRPRRPGLKDLNRLWLNEEQEQIVALDHDAHLRVLGASGSGKTIILLHRALRLALANPECSVLVLTLNRALASALSDAIRALAFGRAPVNIRVASVFDLFQDALKLFHRREEWRPIETIRGSWRGGRYANKKAEFFGGFGLKPHQIFSVGSVKKKGGRRASLFEFVRGKAGRSDEEIANYLWDECRYVQGAFARERRKEYLDIARGGRAVPFREEHRREILIALGLWEAWLIRQKLFEHETVALDLGDALKSTKTRELCLSTFGADHILVDECQDLSTVDLSLIKTFCKDVRGDNALFFAGDTSQQVYGRHQHAPSVGLAFTGRGRILSRNFRNTREILTAARVVTTAYPPPAVDATEIIEPELSPFSAAQPLVIEAELRQQVELMYDLIRLRSDRRIGILTNNQRLLADIYQKLKAEGLDPLLLIPSARMAPKLRQFRTDAPVTLGDLVSVKGYEFDTVFIADASRGCCPFGNTPPGEYWRPAAAFYAAMTRARDELFIAHGSRPSVFVEALGANVVERLVVPPGVVDKRVFLELLEASPRLRIDAAITPGSGPSSATPD